MQYFPNILPKSKAFVINLSGNGESSKFQDYRVAASFITAEIALQRSLFLAVLLSATKLGTNFFSEMLITVCLGSIFPVSNICLRCMSKRCHNQLLFLI